MNFGLENNIANKIKNNKLVQNFIKELQNYFESNFGNNEKEDIQFTNLTHNGNKIIIKYRDKMLKGREKILIDYANKTLDKGQMYYIYSKNKNGYNLWLCEEEKSHNIIEESKLPKNVKIGSVLRKIGDDYILDEKATKEVAEEIYNMKDALFKEQTEFLRSKRIEGHIYEMAENGGDRAWLFDITNNSNEGIEEINFPEELLKNSKEGDLFVYKDGSYYKK